MRGSITEVAGILVGHAHDAVRGSGVTVLLFPEGAMAVADRRKGEEGGTRLQRSPGRPCAFLRLRQPAACSVHQKKYIPKRRCSVRGRKCCALNVLQCKDLVCRKMHRPIHDGKAA
jgi:hypothetical protein